MLISDAGSSVLQRQIPSNVRGFSAVVCKHLKPPDTGHERFGEVPQRAFIKHTISIILMSLILCVNKGSRGHSRRNREPQVAQ